MEKLVGTHVKAFFFSDICTSGLGGMGVEIGEDIGVVMEVDIGVVKGLGSGVGADDTNVTVVGVGVLFSGAGVGGAVV